MTYEEMEKSLQGLRDGLQELRDAQLVQVHLMDRHEREWSDRFNRDEREWSARLARLTDAVASHEDGIAEMRAVVVSHEDGNTELRVLSARLTEAVVGHQDVIAELRALVASHEDGIAEMRAAMAKLFDNMDRFIRGLEREDGQKGNR